MFTIYNNPKVETNSNVHQPLNGQRKLSIMHILFPPNQTYCSAVLMLPPRVSIRSHKSRAQSSTRLPSLQTSATLSKAPGYQGDSENYTSNHSFIIKDAHRVKSETERRVSVPSCGIGVHYTLHVNELTSREAPPSVNVLNFN